MRALAEDLSRRAHRIRDALNASNAPGAQSATIHNQRVHLDFAVAIQEAAASGIEGLVIFHDDDGFFDRVEGRSAPLKNAPSGSSGVTNAAKVSFYHVIGNGPSAAMDDKNGIIWQTLQSSHEPSV
jgi:hypothetical protein